MSEPRRWDIFCAVVDNYGDIGVCWRLARQLAGEFGLTVRLWVDDLAALGRIWPPVTGAPQQRVAGVEIRCWPGATTAFGPADLPDVVVEAFACEPPAGYCEAMAQAASPPFWINLEYLSAESWIDDCHGLASALTVAGRSLRRHFFFPGFSPRSGGLLRERGLLEARDRFDGAAARHFLQGCGVRPVTGERLLSLFSYETATLGALLAALRTAAEPWLLLVPEGRALTALEQQLGTPLPPAGVALPLGRSRLQRIPFLRQDDYDRLLWSCDFNVVRGEDSFVRALWAGRPLLWHIYEQAEGAHRPKLDAFLDRYLDGLPPATAALVRHSWHAWSAGAPAPLGELLTTQLASLTRHARAWSDALAAAPDLASQLVRFCAGPAIRV